MSIAAIFAVAIVIQGPQGAPPPAPAASSPPQDVMSQSVALDRTGAPQLTEEQRRVVVCPHRPPTGSRLARSWCERRAQAEARAQAAREAHEERVLGSGWQSPDIPGAGPL